MSAYHHREGHLCCNVGCDNQAVYGGLCLQCQSERSQHHAQMTEIKEWPSRPDEVLYFIANGDLPIEQVEWPDELDPDRRMKC